MKAQRHKKILELVEKYDIGTQDELIEKLRVFGYQVTQTTVSRDIKQLKLVKGLTADGIYKYIVPNARKTDGGLPVLNTAVSYSVTAVESAQNIIVVKTMPGMANAVAVCIDSLELTHIVGSVAGDDTVLLVMKDNSAAQEMEYKLRAVFEL